MRTRPRPGGIPATTVATVVGLAILAAPSLLWYGRRMTDGSDEPFGILALAAFAFLVPWRRLQEGPTRREAWLLVVAGGGLILVGGGLPILLRSAALILLLCLVALPRGLPSGAVALGLLSLPILASLDFYAGYPLRFACGWVSSHLLGLAGMEVSLSGIAMEHAGLEVIIDRPCSGLRYLWFGWFLTALLASLRRLSPGRTLAVSALAGGILFLANVARVTLLFLAEIRWEAGPAAHESIGLLVFGLALGAITLTVVRFEPGSPRGAAGTRPLSSPPATVPALFFLLLAVTAGAGLRETPPERPAAIPARTAAERLPFLGEWALPVEGAEETRAFLERNGIHSQLFQLGDGLLLLREIERPSRLLHPADDCFRGAGFAVTPLDLWRDRQERVWRRFSVERDGQAYEVRQLIEGPDGWNSGDVSLWYWQALLGRTRGPWKVWVLILPDQGSGVENPASATVRFSRSTSPRNAAAEDRRSAT